MWISSERPTTGIRHWSLRENNAGMSWYSTSRCREKEAWRFCKNCGANAAKLPVLASSAHPEDQLALRLLKVRGRGIPDQGQSARGLCSPRSEKLCEVENNISESLAEKVAIGCWHLRQTRSLHEALIS